MSRVLLATCAEIPDGDPDTVLLAEYLRSAGLEVEIAPWDSDDVDWPGAQTTVIRSTWDYHRRRPEFVRWARSVPALHNPSRLVEWNTDKRYLLDLPADVPVVPSDVLEDPTPSDVRAALNDRGWRHAVLKPTVGLDGHGVSLVTPEDPPDDDRYGGWLLQPLIPEASSEGEVSVVLIEGTVTHSVLRRPPINDFRAQERLGGTVEAHTPPDDVIELARSAVRWIDPAPLYARVDIVRWRGRPHVMEVELVEPSLFFAHGEPALRAMGNALKRLVD